MKAWRATNQKKPRWGDNMLRRDFIKALTISAVLAPGAGLAQSYPSRPVTMVVPYAAGGTFDVMGRILSVRMSEILGQSVIVENTTGAGGIIGVTRVINAQPDGYTFLLGSVGTHAYNQTIYKKPRYHAATDFAPVTLFAEQPMVLEARKDFPAATLPEFVAYVKANQSKLQFGSAGAGSTTHLACSLINSTMGVNVVHVPYKGAGPAHNDLIGGQIDYMCSNIGGAVPFIQGKQVKAVANLGGVRSGMLPDLATAKEQGMNVDVTTWNAMFLPKGTPAAIIKRLGEANNNQAMETPLIKQRMQDVGVSGARTRAADAGISRQFRQGGDRALGRPDQIRRTPGRVNVHALRQPRPHRRSGRPLQAGAESAPSRLTPLRSIRLKHLGATRGIDRFVIVQPSFYGTDNFLVTLGALDALAGNGRGVAVIDPINTPADMLADYDKRGMRGVRLNLYSPLGRGVALDAAFAATVDVVQPLGWHIQVITFLDTLVANADIMARSPVPVVIDHYGVYGQSRPQSAEGRRLLELMTLPHVWMKLSAPYRLADGPMSTRPDREWLAALTKAAPDRCVWGSDWPHPPAHEVHRGRDLITPYRELSYTELVDNFIAALPSADLAGENHARQRRAAVRLLALDRLRRPADNRGGRKTTMNILARALAAVLLLVCTLPASAQQHWPSQTVRIIVAYAPGGTGDIVARLISIHRSPRRLGQSVVIENRGGATGAIGTQAVAVLDRWPQPFLLGQTGEIAINQFWIKDLQYDAQKDLIPVALASVVPLGIGGAGQVAVFDDR